MSDTVFEGGCNCGAVHYTSTAEPVITGLCHCRACQRDSGAAHGAHIGIPKEALTLTGELKFWDSEADSGNIVSRGFCPNCGAPVMSRNSGMPDFVFLRAGSADDPNVFSPQVVVYKKDAANWARFDPDLPAFDGMPPSENLPDGM